METKRRITRSLNNQDPRMISVTIDEAGMKIIRNLLNEAMELELSGLDGFDPKEIDELKSILRKLIAHCSGTQATV